jgi:hypothetical protein
VESGVWSLSLPAPIFWGVLAAWIPIPPSVMAGVLIAAVVYALLNHLLGLREWTVDAEEDEALVAQPQFDACYA